MIVSWLYFVKINFNIGLVLIPKQFLLLRKIHGQEISRQLTGHPRDSIQNPNGSCLNDAATLERENEDLKVIVH